MQRVNIRHWFEAAKQGNSSFLTEHAKDFIGSVDEAGRTALMYFSVLPIEPPDNLVEIESELQDRDGLCALAYACRSFNIDGIKKLWDKEGHMLGLTPLMLAAVAGNSVDTGSYTEQLRQQDHCGMTALMYAVLLDNRQCVNQLASFECGIVNNQGRTALMLAVLCKNTYAFTKLHTNQLEHRRLSAAGWSALAYAVVNGSAEFVRVLLPYEHTIFGATYTLSALSQRTDSQEVSKLTVDDGIQFLVAQKYREYPEKVGLCTICLDELCIVRSYPCGHRCTCFTCSQELQKRKLYSQCPLCRVEIQHWELDRTLLETLQ